MEDADAKSNTPVRSKVVTELIASAAIESRKDRDERVDKTLDFLVKNASEVNSKLYSLDIAVMRIMEMLTKIVPKEDHSQLLETVDPEAEYDGVIEFENNEMPELLVEITEDIEPELIPKQFKNSVKGSMKELVQEPRLRDVNPQKFVSAVPKLVQAPKKIVLSETGSNTSKGTQHVPDIVKTPQSEKFVSDNEYSQYIALTDKKPGRGSRRDREDLHKSESSDMEESSDLEFMDTSDDEYRDDKRASMLRPKATSSKSQYVQVGVYRDQPSYAHIHLDNLMISEVFKFWTDINLYETMHGIELRASTLIADEVRRSIMSKCDIGETRFFRADQKFLRKIIQKAVRPTDKAMFARLLDKSTNFWKPNEDTSSLTIETFPRFYNRLLTYKQEFYQKFEFLAYRNKKNVPKLENKEGGIIRIFLNKLQTDFAFRVFQQLSKSSFTKLKEFISAFYEEADRLYRISIKAKELISYLPPKGYKSFQKRDDPKSRFVQKVNNIEEFEELDFDGFEEDLKPRLETAAKADSPKLSEPDEALPESELYAFGGGNFNRGVPMRPPPKIPVAKAAVPVDKGLNGCYRALTQGKCTTPNCKFDHSAAVLEATLKDQIAKLNKRLWQAALINAVYQPDDGNPQTVENG
jgi:hypothetical protein